MIRQRTPPCKLDNGRQMDDPTAQPDWNKDKFSSLQQDKSSPPILKSTNLKLFQTLTTVQIPTINQTLSDRPFLFHKTTDSPIHLFFSWTKWLPNCNWVPFCWCHFLMRNNQDNYRKSVFCQTWPKQRLSNWAKLKRLMQDYFLFLPPISNWLWKSKF